jgi:hypothetical protein
LTPEKIILSSAFYNASKTLFEDKIGGKMISSGDEKTFLGIKKYFLGIKEYFLVMNKYRSYFT